MVATPSRLPVKAAVSPSVEMVSGNLPAGAPASLAASAAIYSKARASAPRDQRRTIAQPWQAEVYRYVNTLGEVRFSSTLFANMAARAEIGVSEGSSLGRKAVWVSDGPEVSVLAELCPTIRERKKLIRDFMTHYILVGECYLIARARQPHDPEPDSGVPVWEIVAVTELRKIGNDQWQVRWDNENWLDLSEGEPIIRMWNPDPEKRREAWSPHRSMLPTMREIEWLTMHIFTQVRSRLMSAGVWFLPEGLTFSPPPVDAVEGGEDAIALMNEAEKFAVALAASSMRQMDADEVSFPTVVMADAAALVSIDQNKLIKFWSEIDDKAMLLRSAAVQRYALGMDLPPEQVLGASGLAVTGSGGSAGSVNHWGVWANEEQTIANHVEPALDNFVGVLTVAVLRVAVEKTTKVIAYDTASLRLRQDRSKEAMEWYDRGGLKMEVALRETGFDPEHDMMDEAEWTRWMLTRIAGGSATPEQVNEALRLLGIVMNIAPSPEPRAIEAPEKPAPGQPGRNLPPSLEEHPYEGPPRVQHDHSPAPFTALHASAEALVLRAMEKAGNRLLNDGKRGKDRDRSTPAHLAHLSASAYGPVKDIEFDFSLLPTLLGDRPAADQARIEGSLVRYCRQMYADQTAYTRDGLIETLKGL